LAYLFICFIIPGLSRGAFNSSDYKALDDRCTIIMSWQECGRNLLWTNLKYKHSLDGIEENHGNRNQDTRSSGRDMNQRPPEWLSTAKLAD
jgi:hypothetical protein